MELSVKSHFDAAHHLRNYKGKCSRNHGHRWNYAVTIQGDGNHLDKLGMLVDFSDIKAMMKEIEELLDHNDLNTIPPFTSINPTAENLSKFIFTELKPKISALDGITLKEVAIYESPECSVSYP